MEYVLIHIFFANARWSGFYEGKFPLLDTDSTLLKSHLLPLEREVFHIINRIRKAHGLDTLTWDWNLHYMSMIHSRNMAEEDFMSHEGFPQRAMQSGFPICVENVGALYGVILGDGRMEIQTAGMIIFTRPRYLMEVIEGWMMSSGHRRNILFPHLSKGALSVYPGRYRVFITFFACGSPSDSQ